MLGETRFNTSLGPERSCDTGQTKSVLLDRRTRQFRGDPVRRPRKIGRLAPHSLWRSFKPLEAHAIVFIRQSKVAVVQNIEKDELTIQHAPGEALPVEVHG